MALKAPLRCVLCTRTLTADTRFVWSRQLVCRDCLLSLAADEVTLVRGMQLTLPQVPR